MYRVEKPSCKVLRVPASSWKACRLSLNYIQAILESRSIPKRRRRIRGPLAGFLTMFPSLRAVEDPVWALVGYYADELLDLADVLPAGLESLCLREDLFR